MLVGGIIALILIVLLLSGTNHADPAWGKYWMLRPLIFVPVAGASGAVCFHFIYQFLNKGILAKILGGIFGLLIYIISIWMGMVLGLNGTLWN